jgi:hypothetical protein
VLAVEPFGANIVKGDSERAIVDTPLTDGAMAGNITGLTVTGYTSTQSWQGYFGNITGTIQLADAADNVMYNWSLLSPKGEIYSSTNNSINWNYIQCLNFNANGSYTADDLLNAGGTSVSGTNLAILESMFSINATDQDAPNNTFSMTGTHENGFGLVHDLFYTNNLMFTPGECLSTHLFTGNENASDSKFQEVLLYEPESRSVVFTSILGQNDVGFDKNPHDFQMLVLENGHGTDVAETTYYFWVELE